MALQATLSRPLAGGPGALPVKDPANFNFPGADHAYTLYKSHICAGNPNAPNKSNTHAEAKVV